MWSGDPEFHSGKLSNEKRETRKCEVLEKYGLSGEQKMEVDREIDKLMVARSKAWQIEIAFQHNVDNPNLHALLSETTSQAHIDERGADAEIGSMDRKGKLELLHQLRSEMQRLLAVTDQQPHPPKSKLRNMGPLPRRFNGAHLRKRPAAAISEKPRRVRRQRQHIECEEDPFSPDTTAVQTLLDMGYSHRHALDALTENKNDVEAAVQWLFLNCN